MLPILLSSSAALCNNLINNTPSTSLLLSRSLILIIATGLWNLKSTLFTFPHFSHFIHFQLDVNIIENRWSKNIALLFHVSIALLQSIKYKHCDYISSAPYPLLDMNHHTDLPTAARKWPSHRRAKFICVFKRPLPRGKYCCLSCSSHTENQLLYWTPLALCS